MTWTDSKHIMAGERPKARDVARWILSGCPTVTIGSKTFAVKSSKLTVGETS